MSKIVKRIKRSYTYAKFMAKRRNNHEYIIKYLRGLGISIGRDCKIYTKLYSPEAYLIKIGDNVTISCNVSLITHDNSICKVLPEFTDVFGKITIGNNCFIGANSTILPGVTLGDSTIVAAGSIVTKSFLGNVVIGGNPAKVITSIEEYKAKCEPFGINIDGLSYQCKKEILLSGGKLIIK